jgi:hypothetical protein
MQAESHYQEILREPLSTYRNILVYTCLVAYVLFTFETELHRYVGLNKILPYCISRILIMIIIK